MTEAERAIEYLASHGLNATIESVPSFEYGARDPDNHARINIHPSYELALDASKWWAIDHKVYRRQVTEWEAIND